MFQSHVGQLSQLVLRQSGRLHLRLVNLGRITVIHHYSWHASSRMSTTFRLFVAPHSRSFDQIASTDLPCTSPARAIASVHQAIVL